jgi:hypothetical protein
MMNDHGSGKVANATHAHHHDFPIDKTAVGNRDKFFQPGSWVGISPLAS